MKNIFLCSVLALLLGSCCKCNEEGYVVLASQAVEQDAEWMDVATTLAEKHDAEVFIYASSPRECLEQLRASNPRYVAIVEKPENLNRDYVIDMHHVSREVDDDIFADLSGRGNERCGMDLRGCHD